MMKKYTEDSIILREGELNEEMYKIVSGKVAVYLNYGKEDEYLIGILSEQKCFGEFGPLCGMRGLYTAVAVTEVLVLSYDMNNMDYFIKENHREIFEIMHNMANTMHIMKKNIDMLSDEINFIVKYAEEHPEESMEDSRLKFNALQMKLRHYMEYDQKKDAPYYSNKV